MNCKILRKKYVRHGTMSMSGGPVKFDRGEWVTEPCGTPIFGKTKIPVCNSCREGWTHEHNFAVDCAENTKLLNKAQLD